MASSLPVPGKASSSRDFAPKSLGASFRGSSPIAQEVLARDLAECSDDESSDDDDVFEEESDSDEVGPTLYRRPSGIAYGGTSRPHLAPRTMDRPVLTRSEKEQSRNAERSLLRDNHILPPKHPVVKPLGFFRVVYKRMFSTKLPFRAPDEEARGTRGPTETSPLLPGIVVTNGGAAAHETLNEQWEAAVATGQIRTTWQREAKTITVYSVPLIITFLLQYSINIASIFAVGRIGKLELGAVSRKDSLFSVWVSTITNHLRSGHDDGQHHLFRFRSRPCY